MRIVADPVGRPPEGTLRRALADAWHSTQCPAWELCADVECGGRLSRVELATLEAAARQWHVEHPDLP